MSQRLKCLSAKASHFAVRSQYLSITVHQRIKYLSVTLFYSVRYFVRLNITSVVARGRVTWGDSFDMVKKQGHQGSARRRTLCSDDGRRNAEREKQGGQSVRRGGGKHSRLARLELSTCLAELSRLNLTTMVTFSRLYFSELCLLTDSVYYYVKVYLLCKKLLSSFHSLIPIEFELFLPSRNESS